MFKYIGLDKNMMCHVQTHMAFWWRAIFLNICSLSALITRGYLYNEFFYSLHIMCWCIHSLYYSTSAACFYSHAGILPVLVRGLYTAPRLVERLPGGERVRAGLGLGSGLGHSLFLSLSVCLPICLSVRLSVCLTLSLPISACPSYYIKLYESFPLYVYVSFVYPLLVCQHPVLPEPRARPESRHLPRHSSQQRSRH